MKAISSALVKAQQAFGPALKTHTNPAFRSKYADLSACVEAVIDALTANGIFLMQKTQQCENGVIVETVFLHESGEQVSSGPLHVPATKHDAQGYGSALTYARRYSLMAACGIAPEDDDGNAASKRKTDQIPGSVLHTARGGIGDDLPQDWKDYLTSLASECTELVRGGKAPQAAQQIALDKLDDDQRIYLENKMDSKTRAAIKTAEKAIREALTA
jgi:hypothetical protein